MDATVLLKLDHLLNCLLLDGNERLFGFGLVGDSVAVLDELIGSEKGADVLYLRLGYMLTSVRTYTHRHGKEGCEEKPSRNSCLTCDFNASHA